MVAIAVPLGGLLAFLITRTDVRGKRILEVLVLVPMFISSIVLAFGYTVSVGPTGFVSLFVRDIIGIVPWNIYSLPGMILIAGLSHVPHVYLYVSSAMRNLPSDLEEAARTTGASIWQVSRDVTLPMVLPALIFAAALNILLGFETFGIPLVLGDPNGIMVLTTYIYKLTTLFGTPTYQLMAVVAVVLVLITLPLVWMQRKLLRNARNMRRWAEGCACLHPQAGQQRPDHRSLDHRPVALRVGCPADRWNYRARLCRRLGRGGQPVVPAHLLELQPHAGSTEPL